MKIKIGNLTLNGDGQNPKNFSFSERRQIQTEFPISSQRASLFDRKNARASLSFRIERTHVSECAAQVFAVAHSSELAAELPADINIEFHNSRNGKEAEFRFENAMLQSVSITSDGINTASDYVFNLQKIERI